MIKVDVCEVVVWWCVYALHTRCRSLASNCNSACCYTWGISTRKLKHSEILFSNSLQQFTMSLVHQPRQSALPEQSAQFT